MPHDRRSRRTSLIMIGVVCSAVPIGCLRSSNIRPGSGPFPDLSPAGEPQPGARTGSGQSPANGSQAAASIPAMIDQPTRAVLPPAPSPIATDPTVFQTGATPTQAGSEASVEPQPATLPERSGEAPRPEAPPASTPLLDAEIRRVEDVTRQQVESLHATAPSESAAQPSSAPAARPILDLETAKPAEPASEASVPTTSKLAPADPVGTLAEPAPLPQLFAAAQEERSPTGSTIPAAVAGDGKIAPPAETSGPQTSADPRPDPSRDEGREAKEDRSIERTGEPARADEDVTASSPRAPERSPLEIAELRTITKVHRFGSFEPLDPNSLKPGQALLIYWEITGLEYEASGDAFVTRLASHLELRPERGGPIAWEQALPTVVKVCPRRLRDNYVNSRITLPRSLQPGSYRLRLIQTDLVAGRTTSAEIPVTIAP